MSVPPPPPGPAAAPLAPIPGSPPLADYMQRVFAALIDAGILLLVSSPFCLAWVFIAVVKTAGEGGVVGLGTSDRILITLVAALIGLVINTVYFGLTNTRSGQRNGQSYGKQVMKIRVACASGQPVTWVVVLKRYALAMSLPNLLTSLLPSHLRIIYPLIDCLWPLWDDQRQALHDKIAKTYVVKADGPSLDAGPQQYAPPTSNVPPPPPSF